MLVNWEWSAKPMNPFILKYQENIKVLLKTTSFNKALLPSVGETNYLNN